MDVHTKKQRSFNMSQIKSSGTSLEIKFRKYIWKNGIKGYRIKNKISGKPDLYFRKQKLAVFIDGCFWHKCPKDYIRPKSNLKFWDGKILKNKDHDKKINKTLDKQGIKVLRFWEHEIENNIHNCYIKIKKS